MATGDIQRVQRDDDGIVRAPGALMTDVSGDRHVGTGSDLFTVVYDRGVFVDKSLLVRDVVMGSQAMLYCRPRRFGKTTAATMLQDFFECGPCADPLSRSRFERLAIWDADGGRWRAHQGRYPVIMLSLKTATGASWDEELASLAVLVAQECNRHRYLLDSDKTTPFDRAWLERVCSGAVGAMDLKASLQTLSGMLCRHHGERCVVIIDEYDAPIAHAREHGFYGQAVDFMRGWLSGALKTNPALAYGVLTGVQRISKEPVFSGLNNIEVNTALNQTSDERFGFTRQEVAALAAYTGHADRIDGLRSWYDGYRFGEADVYNPWSVLSCLRRNCELQPYWVNTSSNSVLGQAFDADEGRMADKLIGLLQPGATVTRPIDPGIAYSELSTNPDVMWSVLYMAGYLTTDDTQLPEDAMQLRALRVPNAEVRSVFRREVVERARRAAGFDRLEALHRAFAGGDAEALQDELGTMTRDSASMYDLTSEGPCHMLVLGLLFGMPGYADPVSNREAGRGRFDVQAAPMRPDLPLVTVEVKFMRRRGTGRWGEEDEARLAALAQEGLAQIADRAYDAAGASAPDAPNAPGVPGGEGARRVRWGLAFCGKHVAAAAG